MLEMSMAHMNCMFLVCYNVVLMNINILEIKISGNIVKSKEN